MGFELGDDVGFEGVGGLDFFGHENGLSFRVFTELLFGDEGKTIEFEE